MVPLLNSRKITDGIAQSLALPPPPLKKVICECYFHIILTVFLYIYVKLLREIIRRFIAKYYQYTNDTQIHLALPMLFGNAVNLINVCLKTVISQMAVIHQVQL